MFTDSQTLFVGAFALVQLLVAAPTARAADWYRWRGPNLDGISAESAWNNPWPDAGPPVLWKTAVGIGFSSITVNDGQVYTMGNTNGQDTVFCFDATSGAVQWKHSYSAGLRPQYYEGGTSSTPTIAGDRVYTLGKEGQLFCFSAKNGAVLWAKDLHKDLQLEMPRWGFSSSPLVMEERLLLNAGSAGLALNRLTGDVAWRSANGPAGYATPVPVTVSGEQCILVFGAKALTCVRVSDGSLLWTYPWLTKWDLNIADPIVSGDRVFISSFDRGGALLRIDQHEAKEIWHSKELANHFNSSVLFNGYLYGIDGNTDKPPAELRCLDFDTGAVQWSERGLGFGALTIAKTDLLVLSDKGELVLAPASSKSFRPLARVQVLGGKCWITPVLSDGRIYCRNAQGTLICLDVRAQLQSSP